MEIKYCHRYRFFIVLEGEGIHPTFVDVAASGNTRSWNIERLQRKTLRHFLSSFAAHSAAVSEELRVQKKQMERRQVVPVLLQHAGGAEVAPYCRHNNRRCFTLCTLHF